jgi:transposase
MPHAYRSQILDHLGLVAAMFDELGIGEVIDRVTRHQPETRIVTTGDAVKAMVLNGLGFVNHQLYLVPRFFQDKPLSRLLAPVLIEAHQLNDDTLGRALDTLYADDVTALYSLIAATAAERLGLASRLAHLDSTSFHVDGHYNSGEEPAEEVVHITRGYSRDHRPDLNQVLLELIIEHHAGIPVLMKPLSGNSSDVTEFGQVVSEHIAQLQITHGTTSLVADSALYSEANLQRFANTQLKWMTRVPATLSDAQAVLRQADPQTMTPLADGYRYRVVPSTYGGIEQRWVLIDSAQRHPHAQQTVNKQLLTQGDKEVHTFKKLCRTTFACEADAQQALGTFAQSWHATFLYQATLLPLSRYGKRGRPGQGASPAPVIDMIEGALASSLAVHQPLVNQQSCFSLATNELDNTQLPPQELLAGYKGQALTERGFRFLKDPRVLASSLYLKKPERIMALLMVMTVCLLVYAALEYRIRKALKDHDATFPNQKGQPVQNPTARWVFQCFVGIHVLLIPGEGPLVLNLAEEHQRLLRLLGNSYMRLYGIKYS